MAIAAEGEEPCAPHLESETRTSPAHPLCGPRWRIVARSLSLGSIAFSLLSSHPVAPKGFSPQVCHRSETQLPSGQASLPWHSKAPRSPQSLLRLVANPIPTPLAGLLQTPLRRSRTSTALFRPLHPSRRHLQSSTRFFGRPAGHLSLARPRS